MKRMMMTRPWPVRVRTSPVYLIFVNSWLLVSGRETMVIVVRSHLT